MSTLVASKHYDILYEQQKKHEYGSMDKHVRQGEDWVGKRVGIAGYGSIGRQGMHLARSVTGAIPNRDVLAAHPA